MKLVVGSEKNSRPKATLVLFSSLVTGGEDVISQLSISKHGYLLSGLLTMVDSYPLEALPQSGLFLLLLSLIMVL